MKFGIQIRQRNVTGESPFFFFPFKQLEFNSKGRKKKILNCKNKVAKVWYIETLYLNQNKLLWRGIYTQYNDFCFFYPATLCIFVPLQILLVTWNLAPHFSNKKVVHWHFCFALALQAKFKTSYFREGKRILCSNTKTSYHQTSVLWYSWYECSSKERYYSAGQIVP